MPKGIPKKKDPVEIIKRMLNKKHIDSDGRVMRRYEKLLELLWGEVLDRDSKSMNILLGYFIGTPITIDKIPVDDETLDGDGVEDTPEKVAEIISEVLKRVKSNGNTTTGA